MPHKIDPYTSEVIEFDMEVTTTKKFSGELPYRLAKYVEEYIDEMKRESGQQFNHMLTEAVYDGSRYSSITVQHRETVALGPNTMVPLESFKEKEQPVSLPKQTSLSDRDALIAKALGTAIRHAERVSKREHIMADRVERVNQFITSLRRELSYIDKISADAALTASDLTRKDIWYDIGVLNITFPMYGVKFSKDSVQRWLDLAKKQGHTTDAARYEIETDMEELERGLTGCLSAIEDAKRINQETEAVAIGLCKLFE
jgi:hypothetical protein